MYQVNSKTGAIDLDHQDQIGLQTFYKKTVSHYTFKLELCIDHLLVQCTVGHLGGGGRG